MFLGYATKKETHLYFSSILENFPDIKKETLYSEIKDLDFLPSRLGFGTYRTHFLIKGHKDALREALLSGINVIDSASNYGDGASEILIGNTLKELIEAKRITRNQIILITKGGYIQGKNLKIYTQNYNQYPDVIQISDYVYYSIHPNFLETQIEISRKRLGIETIDVYLLHNPEYLLKKIGKEEFFRKIENSLQFLEKKREEKKIRYYGISSNSFVLPQQHKENIDLLRILKFAPPGFKAIQFPANLLEIGYKELYYNSESLVDIAKKHHLWILSNRPYYSFYNNQLYRFSIPPTEFKTGEENPEAIMIQLENQLKLLENTLLKILFDKHFQFDDKYPSPYETINYYKNSLQDVEATYVWIQKMIIPFQKTVSYIRFHLEDTKEKQDSLQNLEIYYQYIKILNYTLSFLPTFILYKNTLQMKKIENQLQHYDENLKHLPLNLQILYLLLNDKIHTVLVGMRRILYVRQLQKIFTIEIPEKKIVAKNLISII